MVEYGLPGIVWFFIGVLGLMVLCIGPWIWVMHQDGMLP